MISRSVSRICSARGSPARRSGPWWMVTRSVGTKRAASFAQFPTTDSGQTSRVAPGRPAFVIALRPARSPASSARICTVFPSPMSSARHAPRPQLSRKASQDKPRRWYARRAPTKLAPVRRARGRASPTSSCPSAPSASTLTTGRPAGPASRPAARRSSSTAVSSCDPSPWACSASRAAVISAVWTSTQRPRTRTRGTFAAAMARSSSSVSSSSPTAATQENWSRALPPISPPTTSDSCGFVRALTLSPSPARRSPHQVGTSTPKPACSKRGTPSRRKDQAPSASVASRHGAASLSTGSSGA